MKCEVYCTKAHFQQITDLKKQDHYLKDRKGLKSRRMVGANNTRIDGDKLHISKGIVEETADKFIK